MAPIERQESRYIQVQTTKIRQGCVGPVCKNEEEDRFSSSPEYTFGICSAHYEESCFTGTFDPSQRRQIKLGSLLTIWKKKERTPDGESERRLMKKNGEKGKKYNNINTFNQGEPVSESCYHGVPCTAKNRIKITLKSPKNSTK